MKIKYKKIGYQGLTPCPYDYGKDSSHSPPMVGSIACTRCPYNKSTSRNKRGGTVDCCGRTGDKNE